MAKPKHPPGPPMTLGNMRRPGLAEGAVDRLDQGEEPGRASGNQSD